MKGYSMYHRLIAIGVMILLVAGCSRRSLPDPNSVNQPVSPMDYTIQVGAFAVQSNAINLTDRLRSRGLDAYYFIAEDKLYKVRFGNYSTRAIAQADAVKLQQSGLIHAYYIVQPPLTKPADIARNLPAIRRNLVRTANRFIGCPYRYGGESEDGFDCSGLVMTVYKLNGLDLPRVSRDQFKTGRRVALSQLQAGDLVFFRTGPGDGITHVGLYTGNGKFIHAPGKGKKVRVASLSDKYFAKRYAGARGIGSR